MRAASRAGRGCLPWQDRQRMLEDGQADLGGDRRRSICAYGLPARIRGAAAGRAGDAAVRHQALPIYFSDVIVRADSQLRTFADLRGARFAFNEPNSYSGYQIVRAHLAVLRLIIAGAADVAALDRIVLERELQLHPDLASAFRIIHTLGPGPSPPLVATRRLAPETVRALRDVLLQMPQDGERQTRRTGAYILCARTT